jgi:phosphoribosylglycinamide formyltransferase 1
LILETVNLAIFASGSGTNAENIASYFKDNSRINARVIFTNNAKAGIVSRAQKLGIDCVVFNKDDFYKTNQVLSLLEKYQIDWIILAGFLWLVPKNLIAKFPNRIINIHPALLPKYGGKGMYGTKVHEAVITNKEIESGISIHTIDEVYDRGSIVFQKRCPVTPDDNAETLAKRIHQLEYEHYPKVIENLVSK